MSGVPQGVEPPPGELGMRILHMLLFAFVFWVVSWVLLVTALAQLLVRVLSGRPSAELVRFGQALARYTAQVVEYLTFVTDRVPYPVGVLPAE
jgi:hypothetical protein